MFAVPHVGVLGSGQSYTETATFTLPPSAEGSYFVVETNVDPNLTLTDEQLFLKQIEDILRRAEQALGKPLIEATGEDLRSLTRNDILRILTGDQERPKLVFEGPFTDNNTGGLRPAR